MKVFVVMGNDFPAAVFSDIAAAEAYCNRHRQQDRKTGAHIYWRVYPFDLDKENLS